MIVLEFLYHKTDRLIIMELNIFLINFLLHLIHNILLNILNNINLFLINSLDGKINRKIIEITDNKIEPSII